jgi:putative FmdB family regulatory protein
MPIYNYKCEHCEEEIEKLQKINDPSPECPGGHGSMQKLLTTPAFNFKNGKGTTTGLRMNIAGKR